MENSTNNGTIPPITQTGLPVANTQRSGRMRMMAILGAVCAVIVVLVVLVLVVASRDKPAKKAASAPAEKKINIDTVNGQIEQKKREHEEKQRTEAARQKEIEAAQAAETIQQAGPNSESTVHGASASSAGKAQPAAATTATKEAPPTPKQRKLDGAVLFVVAPSRAAPAATTGTQAPVASTTPGTVPGAAPFRPAGVVPSGAPGGIVSDPLSARLQPPVFRAKMAGRLPNQDFLLRQGTMAPCETITAIKTTHPGIVLCQLTQDVYSANGKVVLLDRGSRVFGQQTAGLKPGQEDAFVAWSTIDTPGGVTIEVESPAADQLGASGIPGYVDNHFQSRFGAALLLSTFKDASAALTRPSGNQQGQATVVLGNTQQTTNDMATEALKKGIDIPPTGHILPGRIVYIMVARNISFDDVYGLR